MVSMVLTALLWDPYMVSCSIKRSSVVRKGWYSVTQDVSSVSVTGTIAEWVICDSKHLLDLVDTITLPWSFVLSSVNHS